MVVIVVRVVVISRQRELNDELGSYLNKRYNKGDNSGSRSFFKKVDTLIPKKKESDTVPELDGVNTAVYEEDMPRQGFFQAIVSFFQSSKNTEDLDEEIDMLPEAVQEEAHEVEEAIEEIDDEVHELEEQREGLFARLFSIFSRSRSDDDDMIDEEMLGARDVELDEHEVLKKETRAVLKSVHKWLSRLPPDQIDAFKRSPDFIRYKELLDKYGLIK